MSTATTTEEEMGRDSGGGSGSGNGDDSDGSIALARLADRQRRLEGRVRRVERVLGEETADGDGGSGVAGALARLATTIGHAPDLSTSDEGSGLCRVVAELAAERRIERGSVAKWSALAATGGVALATTIAKLVELLG